MRGSNRAETIVGNSGANVLEGRGGNDLLEGGGSSDTLDGGAGIDTANYESNAARVVVTLRDGADGSAAEHVMVGTRPFVLSTDTLRSIENVRGSAFNDSITGNSENNRLSGEAGDDNISGGSGNDTLVGGSQNDIDRLIGGTGFDTFLYQSRDDSRNVVGRTGDSIGDFNVNEDTIDLRALHVDAADLLIENRTINGLRFATVTEDVNGNAQIDQGEFSINLLLVDVQTSVTLQDIVLV